MVEIGYGRGRVGSELGLRWVDACYQWTVFVSIVL